MHKKMMFCLIALLLSHNISYSFEGQSGISDGYKITQRPFKQALIQGFKRGGRQALLFASPIMLVGRYADYTTDAALGLPGMTGVFGGVAGSVLATASVLLPMKKEDIGRTMIREKCITRASAIGAHTGTSIGTTALVLCLIFNAHVK